MSSSVDADRVWVLLITEGTTIDLPVEIYVSRSAAVREAERWAWTFAGHGEIHIDRPSFNHWRVGIRDVRLVAYLVNAFDPDAEWWVGSHSTNDGYIDPLAVLLLGRAAARSWTLEPPEGETLTSHVEHAWSVGASFARGKERSDSLSVLAKVVMGREFDVSR
jgi:hypothetical protein